MTQHSGYERPTLTWIKRRARRVQQFYGTSRRLAIFDAWLDYIHFTGGRATRLVCIQGGKS